MGQVGVERLAADIQKGFPGMAGFCRFRVVGQQVHLVVGGEDFYIDLLFYHLKLRCYVIVDLKATGFKPEYTGRMNFYLSALRLA